MSKLPIISRRLLLAGFWLAGSSSVWAQVGRGSDQGIGGTGKTGGDDQGIGGTGIVGIIQRFGSIYVNGQRVSYAPDVPVRIDGVAASAKSLRIGQLARVLARPQANGVLATNRIDVISEVTGPIDSTRAGELTVLGQRVAWSGNESWRRAGTNVAVFGLRRTDGVIVASLVQQRRAATARVAGLLERDRDGLRIGGLRIDGVDTALVGQRVQVEGHAAQGVMQAARARLDDLFEFSGASRLLIEAYVRNVGDNLQFGSGYTARDGSRFQPLSDARVVVNATYDRARGLQVESMQSVDRFPGSSTQTPGAPGARPGGGPGGGPTAPGGGGRSDVPTSFGPGGRPGAPGGGPAGPVGGGYPGGPSGPGGGFPGGPGGPGGGFPGGPGGGFPGGGPGGPGGGLPGGPGGPGGGGFGGGPGGGPH